MTGELAALSPTLQARLLFGGLVAVLVLATVIGRILGRRQPDDGVVANLNARVDAWWAMVIACGLAFLVGPAGLIVLFAIASFFALREFVTLTPTRRADHLALVVSFFVVTPVQYILLARGWYGLFAVFVPVYAFLFLPILSALRADTRGFLERTAKLQWGLMVAVYCISHAPALMLLQFPGREGREPLLVFFLIFVVQASDVLQYVWGKLLGRHKIAPGLSPSKTVEGFVGGVLSATGLGAAMWWITPFTPGEAAGMALAATLMGFLGGLVMSAIKRDRGVKDWGQMIEGHGGMLDRLDSVCFAAPVFFHLARFLWKA